MSQVELITDIEKIVEKLEEEKYFCELCYGIVEHYHHSISGRGKRIEHQNQYSVYKLCSICHRAVHNNRLLELQLIFETQNRYKRLGFDENTTRRMMGGRIYTRRDIELVYEKRGEDIDYMQVESITKGLSI